MTNAMNDNNINKPWYDKPAPLPSNAHIAIIGGGIAGVCTYLHLKKAGFKATIIDKNNIIMGEASGNPVAILDPFLSPAKSIEQKYYLQAYTYALQFYANLPNNAFVQTKLMKIAKNQQELDKFSIISNSYDEGLLQFDGDRLVLLSSGYIDPARIKHFLKEDILTETIVADIIQHDDLSWSLQGHTGKTILHADAVILANSFDLSNFEQTRTLNLQQVEGQLTYVSHQFDEKQILCSQGFVTPVVSTEFGPAHICGATFEQGVNPTLSANAHHENIKNAPYPFENPKIIGGRRAIRAMSPDHLPLCGSAPNITRYQKYYDGLQHGPKHKIFKTAPYHKNLFIIAGLGSRGFVQAPILGKYLTNIISGLREPFDSDICHALHPARFMIRKLSKK